MSTLKTTETTTTTAVATSEIFANENFERPKHRKKIAIFDRALNFLDTLNDCL